MEVNQTAEALRRGPPADAVGQDRNAEHTEMPADQIALSPSPQFGKAETYIGPRDALQLRRDQMEHRPEGDPQKPYDPHRQQRYDPHDSESGPGGPVRRVIER